MYSLLVNESIIGSKNLKVSKVEQSYWVLPIVWLHRFVLDRNNVTLERRVRIKHTYGNHHLCRIGAKRDQIFVYALEPDTVEHFNIRMKEIYSINTYI